MLEHVTSDDTRLITVQVITHEQTATALSDSVFTSLLRGFLGDALSQERSLCQASEDYFETVLVQNEVITTIEESLDYVGHQVTTARAIDLLMG